MSLNQVLYLLGKKNQLLGSQTECMLIMGPHTNFTGKSIKKIVNALLPYFGKISASDFSTGTKFGRNVCRYEDTFLKVGF